MNDPCPSCECDMSAGRIVLESNTGRRQGMDDDVALLLINCRYSITSSVLSRFSGENMTTTHIFPSASTATGMPTAVCSLMSDRPKSPSCFSQLAQTTCADLEIASTSCGDNLCFLSSEGVQGSLGTMAYSDSSSCLSGQTSSARLSAYDLDV